MSDDRDRDDAGDATGPAAGWGADWGAPADLRADTLAAAQRRGLVRGRTMNRWTKWIGAAAVVAVAYLAGFGTASQRAQAPGKEEGMSAQQAPAATAAAGEATSGPRYAVFLFEDAAYEAPPADGMMERVREYGGWARGLAESGRYVTGEKLSDDGAFARIEGGTLQAGGPWHDAARGALTGYFVIGAASLEEALGVARTCPHLKYGGSIEVRALES